MAEKWLIKLVVRRMMNVDLKIIIMLYIHSGNTGGSNLVHAGLSWFPEPVEKIKGIQHQTGFCLQNSGKEMKSLESASKQHDVDIKAAQHKRKVKSCHPKIQSGKVTGIQWSKLD